MAAPLISVVAALDADLDDYPPVAEEVIRGRLDMRARLLWVSPDRTAATGIWRCEPVTLRLHHPFDETFVVLDGRLTVTPEGGVPRMLVPGDAIVIPRGATNVWQIHETVTKMFSVHQASWVAETAGG